MEALYIEECIQKAKVALHDSPKANPFALHRILAEFFENISSCLQSLQEEVDIVNRTTLPTMDQANTGIQRLSEISIQTEHLKSSITNLDDLNFIGEAPANLYDVMRIDTSPLSQMCTQLYAYTQKILTRYQLQKEYLLYKEMLTHDPLNILALHQTPRQIAGQYLYLSNGDQIKASELLLDIAEQIYATLEQASLPICDTEIFQAITILKGLPENRRGGEAIEDPLKESDALLIDEENNVEITDQKSVDETNLDTVSTTEQPEELPKSIPEESEIHEPNTLHIVEEPKADTQEDVNQDAQQEKKTPDTITIDQYRKYKEEVEKLKTDHREARARLAKLQNELGTLDNAKPEQVRKWSQTRAAYLDIEERLKKAAKQLDNLNKLIRAGTIQLCKSEKISQTKEPQLTRKPDE